MTTKLGESPPLFTAAGQLGDDWARANREALAFAVGPGSLTAAAGEIRAALRPIMTPALGTAEVLDSLIRQQELLPDEPLA